jgi:hypothetical protein
LLWPSCSQAASVPDSARLHGLRDGRHRDAQRFGALALHAQEGARRVGAQAAVDGRDVGRGGKGLLQPRGHLLLRPASSGP